MNKSDLTKALSEAQDLPIGKAEEIVDVVFGLLSGALIVGDRIEIRGFGSFTVREYEGYSGRNPKTGDKIPVESKKLPIFKCGKDLREKLKQL